jgi:hypothetical protein
MSSRELRNTAPEAGKQTNVGRIDVLNDPSINQKSFASEIVRLMT